MEAMGVNVTDLDQSVPPAAAMLRQRHWMHRNAEPESSTGHRAKFDEVDVVLVQV